jgi:hypothetical protein
MLPRIVHKDRTGASRSDAAPDVMFLLLPVQLDAAWASQAGNLPLPENWP